MESLFIMIVEDEAIIAKNLKRSLLNNGFKVTVIVNNAEKAIRDAKNIRPDLVLMDIHLKGEKDGIYASEKIWEKYKIPVVFLTAHSDRDTFKRAKLSQPFGYITKPFDERQLCMAIELAIFKDRAIKRELKLQKEIKNLQGMIPVCAKCKKIREDDGFWEQIESYITKHSEAVFTHCICPECKDDLYGEFLDNVKK